MTDNIEAIASLTKRADRLHQRLDRLRDDANDLVRDIAELPITPPTQTVTKMPGMK